MLLYVLSFTSHQSHVIHFTHSISSYLQIYHFISYTLYFMYPSLTSYYFILTYHCHHSTRLTDEHELVIHWMYHSTDSLSKFINSSHSFNPVLCLTTSFITIMFNYYTYTYSHLITSLFNSSLTLSLYYFNLLYDTITWHHYHWPYFLLYDDSTFHDFSIHIVYRWQQCELVDLIESSIMLL